ncbi:MAG: ABC transporter permease [Pseudomonadota bacterium]
MNPALLIAWREYRQYILSRGFLLFLAIFPVGIIAGSAAIALAEQAKPARHYVIFDETGQYTESIEAEIKNRALRRLVASWSGYVAIAVEPSALEDSLIPEPFRPGAASLSRARAFAEAGGLDAAKDAASPYLRQGAPEFVPSREPFIRLALPDDVAAARDVASAAERLRPYLLGEKTVTAPSGEEVALFAAVLVPRGYRAREARSAAVEEASPSAEYWSRNLTDDSLREAIAQALSTTLRRRTIAELGLDGATLDRIADIDAPLDAFRPDRAVEEAALNTRDTLEIVVPGALTYMLVFIIMGIGNLLLTNTIEERSNKIVEVLLSSVTAEELMIGKLIGIGAVGLTLPTIFLVGGSLAAFANPNTQELAQSFLEMLFATPLFAIYIFYFFCAYAIFAMIFLAIGAVSNSLQDAQSYMGPITLLLFAPLPFVMMMYQNPNGVVATVLTWIPIYTPYAVLLRAASDPPLLEIVGATLLMLAFAVFLVRFMGRIFRRALLQAAPPKMSELWRLGTRSAD